MKEIVKIFTFSSPRINCQCCTLPGRYSNLSWKALILYLFGNSSQIAYLYLALVYYRYNVSVQYCFKYHTFPTGLFLSSLKENPIVHVYFGSSHSACKVSVHPLPAFNKVNWLIDLYTDVQSNKVYHLIRYCVWSPVRYTDLTTPFRKRENWGCEISRILSMTNCLAWRREI